MNETILLATIILPAVAGVPVILTGKAPNALRAAIMVLATAANLALAATLFMAVRAGPEMHLSLPWVGSYAGLELGFSLRLDQFSAFILLSAAFFAFMVGLYCWKFMAGRNHAAIFAACLLWSVAMIDGAVLADHLVTLLFFWEGLLVTAFAMIAVGRPGAWRTAVKAFIIVGIGDLCLMLGIILAGWQAGSLSMSQIHLVGNGLGAAAMVLLMIAAISKGGAMPFHTWIPDAAVDAPLPFMALFPASMEKLLGIYFLVRITTEMFHLSPGSWLSTMLMAIGAVTIILAVAMALVQKNYKRLLSYHAISQVGYMVLGVGTALPAGIIGGVFHMINNALYKNCLFLTGGAVERQAGSADLGDLGGLARKMPITFLCFVITAASISGFPLTNGFYSKELIYEGALHSGTIYYLAAVIGTFLTAASFLKLGHAAYLGRRRSELEGVREAPFSMLVPMLAIAGVCVLFGPFNYIALGKLIQPGLPAVVGDHDFSTFLPHSWTLAGLATLAIVLAFLNHLYGVRRSGSGLGAVEHIHHAPVLATIYDQAEKRRFDPYNWLMGLIGAVGRIGWRLDRLNDWLYDGLIVGVTRACSGVIRLANTGNYSAYVVWCLAGAVAIVWFLVKSQ